MWFLEWVIDTMAQNLFDVRQLEIVARLLGAKVIPSMWWQFIISGSKFERFGVCAHWSMDGAKWRRRSMVVKAPWLFAVGICCEQIIIMVFSDRFSKECLQLLPMRIKAYTYVLRVQCLGNKYIHNGSNIQITPVHSYVVFLFIFTWQDLLTVMVR